MKSVGGRKCRDLFLICSSRSITTITIPERSLHMCNTYKGWYKRNTAVSVILKVDFVKLANKALFLVMI